MEILAKKHSFLASRLFIMGQFSLFCIWIFENCLEVFESIYFSHQKSHCAISYRNLPKYIPWSPQSFRLDSMTRHSRQYPSQSCLNSDWSIKFGSTNQSLRSTNIPPSHKLIFWRLCFVMESFFLHIIITDHEFIQ